MRALFTNVAAIPYNGTVVNSNVTTGEIQQTLAATKHSLANTYKQATLDLYREYREHGKHSVYKSYVNR